MASNKRVEYVYFDLGNVLLEFDPEVACQGLADLVGTGKEEARRALYDSGLEVEYEHGRLTNEQFAAQLRSNLSLTDSNISDQSIIESISNMFTPIAAMEGVLSSVQNTGCRVGLLSNTCLGHWQWIEHQEFAVMDFEFDTTVLSFEVGSMKPDAKIYETAQTLANTPSDRILFLDDRQENVLAAHSHGWHAAECCGGQQAIDVLKEYGLMDMGS